MYALCPVVTDHERERSAPGAVFVTWVSGEGMSGGKRAVSVKDVTREGQGGDQAAARVRAMCSAARTLSATPSSCTVMISGASGQGASLPDGSYSDRCEGVASPPGTTH